MKVELWKDDAGQLKSFSVPNTFLWRRGFVRVVRKIPGAVVTRTPIPVISWFREDAFCEFTLNGVHFVADEPFGDNSFYDINCSQPGPELEMVAEHFRKQKWPLGL